MSVSAFVTINQTNCGCDGGISIFAYGGTSPYTYSINSGLTFKKMPFFSNLCSGQYFILVKDDNDFIYTKPFTINKPNDPIIYNVKLLTTNKKVLDDGINSTIEYTTNIQIVPSLPNDVYITFDVNHYNFTTTSPILSATTFTSNSTLTIGSGTTPISLTLTSETISNNTIPGCQNENLIQTSTTETWQNLTYYNDYNFELVTTTSSQKNGDYLCYVNTTSDTYTIENLKIFGCSCCNVIPE
jgi:hypothetical protein